jgi:hypothetical protein
MDKDGRFVRPLDRSAGVWIAIQDTYIVEWFAAEYVEEEEGDSDGAG